jgi:hypothetical protein
LLSDSKLLGAPGVSVITLSMKLRAAAGLAHGGNPVTRWMAANVAVAQDPTGNLKSAKDNSTERIDGIFTLIILPGWPSRGFLPASCADIASPDENVRTSIASSSACSGVLPTRSSLGRVPRAPHPFQNLQSAVESKVFPVAEAAQHKVV